MNKRFQELAAEAYRKVTPGPDVYNEADAAWMGFDELEKVFAELIVKECAGIAYEYDIPNLDGPGEFIGNMIKKRFGVKG